MQLNFDVNHASPQSTRRPIDDGHPYSSDAFATASAHSALNCCLNALEWAWLARAVADVSAGWMVLETCEDNALSCDLLERRLDHEGREEQPDRIAWFSQPHACGHWLRGVLNASSQSHWVR